MTAAYWYAYLLWREIIINHFAKEEPMKYSCLRLLISIITLTTLLGSLEPISAQWSNDPAVNTAICTAASDQTNAKIVTDGAGGAIITWMDSRGTAHDIYAQRIDATGAVRWTANGVSICSAIDEQFWPVMISDGVGGAIITWQDRRNGSYHIYAQRINAVGAVQWIPDGVPICTTSPSQFVPTLASDGAGGAIITWEHNRGVFDVYAQRIDSSGAVRWTANGVAICTVAGNFDRYPVVVSSGIGGAIIAWRDYRTGISNVTYAQRIDSSGTVLWTTDGVSLGGNGNEPPIIVTDSAGGAIVAWGDYRSGTNNDIYAQRIDSSGTVRWIAGGVSISTAVQDQRTASMVEDGVGGAVLVWKDERNGTESHIYGQRINGSGTVQWTPDGVAVCTVAGNQYVPKIASDASTGVEIAWQDNRNAGGVGVYVQRLDVSGIPQWTAGGTKAGSSANPPTIVANGTGGAIIAWPDYRSGTNNDIYAQQVGIGNVLPIELVSFSASQERSSVHIRWTTATEINGYGFDIQRNIIRNLNTDISSWESIGFVEGAGTSTSPRQYSFEDKTVTPGIYSYRIKQIDKDGSFKYTQTAEVEVGSTPKQFSLSQNYPNPFNPSTTLEFTFEQNGIATVKIYNMLGQQVATVFDQVAEAGKIYQARFNASRFTSGVYMSVLESSGKRLFRKMLLVK